MYLPERIITAISILWVIIALIYQWISARGGGRIDYSAKAGSPIKGIIYNFTWAMLPAHKETISRHPVWFTIGVLMHIGILAAIALVFVDLLTPRPYEIIDVMNLSPIPGIISTVLSIIFLIASVCAISLLIKRLGSHEMRAMSSPDDYISILLVMDFLLVALARELGLVYWSIFLIHSAILFFYLPLGKLRHALFFFIARADYGSRLGYRGTYPAKNGARN